MHGAFSANLDRPAWVRFVVIKAGKPQGVTYEFKPKAAPEREEMRRFIEMCFDPRSPMNEKLKEALFHMMEDT